MKIAVVAANGKEGKLVVREAIRRGHDVTVFVRGENRTDAEKCVSKDLFNLTADDLADFDVVVDAFGAIRAASLAVHGAKGLGRKVPLENLRPPLAEREIQALARSG